MRSSSGHFEALAAAVLFSTGGAALKASDFTALQLSALRSGIAAVALLLWIVTKAAHARWSRRRIPVTKAAPAGWPRRWMPVRISWPIVGGALAYAATVTLFVAANRLTTSANTIFLQSSAPLFLVILSPLLLRERFRARDTAFLMLIALGMWLAFSGSLQASRTAPDPPAGNSLALISSLTWALTLLALRYVERTPADHGGGLSVVILGNVVASLVAAPALAPWPMATIGSWIIVVYLGVAQIAVAYVCLTASLRHLPALDVSLLLLLEPVLNPIWTWLIHGERPGYAVISGGALILASTAVRAVLDSRDGSRLGSG